MLELLYKRRSIRKYKDIKVGTVFEMDDGYNISLKLIEYEGTYI